jgi:hypothetical protein
VASIIFTKWGSLAWLIEEYMEDFLWLSQQVTDLTTFLKAGEAVPLPSPAGVKLSVTGARINEKGEYELVITCESEVPSVPVLGTIYRNEEDWALNEAFGITKGGDVDAVYKGIHVRLLFKTEKGDVLDEFIKPPYATVKRTVKLPAPPGYFKAESYIVAEVDEDKYKQKAANLTTITIAGLGVLTVGYAPELAALAAKLAGLSPATMDYWILVTKIADALKALGYTGLAGSIAAYATERLTALAKAAPPPPPPPTPPPQPQPTPGGAAPPTAPGMPPKYLVT